MQSSQYYPQLSRTVSKLLYDDRILIEGLDILRDSFIDGVYGSLETCFGISFKKDAFQEYIKATKGSPSQVDMLKYIGTTIDTPETYVVLNYYYSKFIKIFFKCVPKEQYEKVNKIIEEEKLSPAIFHEIENDYKQMMLTKKLATKFATA